MEVGAGSVPTSRSTQTLLREESSKMAVSLCIDKQVLWRLTLAAKSAQTR